MADVLPRFADLRNMATELAGDPRYKSVATLMRKASVAQSCAGDLAQAKTCCEALDDLVSSPRKRGTMSRSATEASLLQTGVVLYCRGTATVGKMGERGSIDIRAKLTPEQLIDHDALVRIRNRALAHVYGDETIDGDVWHRHEMFLVEIDVAWLPAGAAKRLQYHAATLERLKRQLPVAHRLVTATFHRHLNRLTDAMNTNPIPLATFERHLFDPIERFGGVDGVAAILAGRTSGSTSFLRP